MLSSIDDSPTTTTTPRLDHRGPGSAVRPNPVRIDCGAFANPFASPGAPLDQRLGALVKYAVWLAGRLDLLTAVRDHLAERDLVCTCPLDDPSCHRNVLLDVAAAPRDPLTDIGHAMALTLRQPWASMLLVPGRFAGKTVENRLDTTEYRGPVLIYGGARTDQAGLARGDRLGLTSMNFHQTQKGWLGAAVLTDVHPAARQCCPPWGDPPRRPGTDLYHWVFDHPARLAIRGWGRGFEGLQRASWSALMTPPNKLSALSESGRR